MNRKILFIHGGGEGGYTEDRNLVSSLKNELDDSYTFHYPQIRSDEALPDFGWTKQILRAIHTLEGELLLIGHSLGASMLLKCIAEHPLDKPIAGIFLLATPFWSGNENWVQGLKLKDNFQEELPENVPLFFYHCIDDDEVPVDHLEHYHQKLPQAKIRKIPTGGHQMNQSMAVVAADIVALNR